MAGHLAKVVCHESAQRKSDLLSRSKMLRAQSRGEPPTLPHTPKQNNLARTELPGRECLVRTHLEETTISPDKGYRSGVDIKPRQRRDNVPVQPRPPQATVPMSPRTKKIVQSRPGRAAHVIKASMLSVMRVCAKSRAQLCLRMSQRFTQWKYCVILQVRMRELSPFAIEKVSLTHW